MVVVEGMMMTTTMTARDVDENRRTTRRSHHHHLAGEGRWASRRDVMEDGRPMRMVMPGQEQAGVALPLQRGGGQV